MSTVRVRNIAPHPAQGIKPGEEGEVDERLLTATSFFERVEADAPKAASEGDPEAKAEERPKRTRRRKAAPKAD